MTYHSILVRLVQQQLAQGSGAVLQVRGTSMRPLLQPGDTIHVVPLGSGPVRRGAVLLVERPHEFVTHRLVARRGTHWYTMGDWFTRRDAPVGRAALVGRVVAIETNARLIKLQAPYRVGIAWLLGWLGWLQGERWPGLALPLRVVRFGLSLGLRLRTVKR